MVGHHSIKTGNVKNVSSTNDLKHSTKIDWSRKAINNIIVFRLINIKDNHTGGKYG